MTVRDLLSPSTIRALCARAGIRPSRAAGQHFLVHAGTLARIVAAVDPQPDDTIIEVGAGFGILTLALAPHISCLIAIERDRRIAPILRDFSAPYGNIEVAEDDILRLLRARHRSLRAGCTYGMSGRTSDRYGRCQIERSRAADAELRSTISRAARWKLTANLPYSITSDFLRLLFDAMGTGALPPPERIVLLLQREVVDRLCADPSRPRERHAVGILTILAQLHGVPRRVARVPASHFWPPPSVESAVVVLDHCHTPEEITALLAPVSHREFLSLVRGCFAGRRKQVRTSLPSATHRLRAHGDAILDRAGLPRTIRPEELTFEQWIALARALHSP